ncbi:hypothetical protein DFO67_11822 [Modicisalibacter xianhensis]|uniref:CopG family transcriptional regulator n=1 Tax=Modicisalibacter xianhensis TaxID=442341 RepID=A0A4R8FHE3_9GAMM|nr:DUF411 domain-containing protein [Halomonas xianhensis]TDX25454.1 hypothetical protein DFO67_11822 [Halomonas xianhensis]
MMHRLTPILGAGLLSLAMTTAHADATTETSATLYKNPSCVCCSQYADHMKAKGMDIEIIETEDLGQVKASGNVPHGLYACHTMLIGDYVIEGHVPFAAIERLLEETPDIDGIALAGMPAGSPGMPGPKQGEFEIMGFDDNESSRFMTL